MFVNGTATCVFLYADVRSRQWHPSTNVALPYVPPQMRYLLAGFAWIYVFMFEGEAQFEYGRGESTLTMHTQLTDEDKKRGIHREPAA